MMNISCSWRGMCPLPRVVAFSNFPIYKPLPTVVLMMRKRFLILTKMCFVQSPESMRRDQNMVRAGPSVTGANITTSFFLVNYQYGMYFCFAIASIGFLFVFDYFLFSCGCAGFALRARSAFLDELNDNEDMKKFFEEEFVVSSVIVNT